MREKNYIPDLLPPFFAQFQYNVVQPYKQTCTELLFAPFQNVDFAPFELFFEYQSHNPIRGVLSEDLEKYMYIIQWGPSMTISVG